MPIENERKFVLDDTGGALETRLANSPGVTRTFLRQAYLEASGVRIRAIDGRDGIHNIFSFKRPVDDQMVEIETEISQIDFDRLWKIRCETLQKARYSWPDGVFHWDVDFFKTDDGQTYFALAEVEMPENEMTPPAPPASIAASVLYLAPSGDPRFSSKRLSDRNHAERLLAETRRKGNTP